MSDLAAEVKAARSKLDQALGEARALAAAERAAKARIELCEQQIELHERVITALTQLGEEEQDAAQRYVEEMVTRGLQAVFSEELSFHLVQSVRAGQANVEFVIRDGELETPVLEARGGGMAAVTGFLLRLAVLLKKPEVARVLWLDESFAHVSAEYRGRVGEFLREICTEAGVQVIMVTHDPEYAELADEVHRFSQVQGETSVSSG